MNNQKVLRDNIDAVRSMKARGLNSMEIADVLGVESPEAVRHFCWLNGIKCDGFILKHTEAVAAERIHETSDGMLEYVSGYETKESMVKVRCLKCGGEFERTFHHLTTHKPVACPLCAERERQIRQNEKEERKADKAWAKAVKAYERQFNVDDKPTNIIPHICPVCGAITTKPKYCSETCRNKACYKSGDHRRRVLIKSAMVDSDITVEGLFKRDRGICAICGKPCDFNDYERRNGYFIAGNNYPSTDHIVPLAKGGKHSWENVQLAHRICNTLKRDNTDVKGVCSRVL